MRREGVDRNRSRAPALSGTAVVWAEQDRLLRWRNADDVGPPLPSPAKLHVESSPTFHSAS